MHIVQILLPLADNQGRRFSESLLREVREELVSRFGGLTAYGRAPAMGVWGHAGNVGWARRVGPRRHVAS